MLALKDQLPLDDYRIWKMFVHATSLVTKKIVIIGTCFITKRQSWRSEEVSEILKARVKRKTMNKRPI